MRNLNDSEMNSKGLGNDSNDFYRGLVRNFINFWLNSKGFEKEFISFQKNLKACGQESDWFVNEFWKILAMNSMDF